MAKIKFSQEDLDNMIFRALKKQLEIANGQDILAQMLGKKTPSVSLVKPVKSINSTK